MPIEPFIEAPHIRIVPQPVSGGIDVSEIEHVTQGVSVNNVVRRAKGVLPKIGAGTNNHQIENRSFGQPKEHADDTPFNDVLQKVTAEAYVEDSSQFDSSVVVEFESYDGAIEPLNIRDIALFTNIEDTVAHQVKGNVEVSNIVGHQFVPLPQEYPTNVARYLDNGQYLGPISPFSAIFVPGDLSPLLRIINAYNDATIFDENLVDSGDTFDGSGNLSSINSEILSMTGSIDDDLRPRGYKSAAAGFTYSNNAPGTDSLAFGGLNRS